MAPKTKPCPKCGTVLALPDPMPERIGCPKCKAVMKIRDGKVPVAVAAVVLPASTTSSPHAPQQAHAVASSPVPATKVAGHTLMGELARGGLGVIYLAHHDMLGDYRAIKRPLSGGGLDIDMLLARFRREVQAVGALRHDNIIRTYDAGFDTEGPYLVMEYLDGMSLSTLAASHCKFPVGEACELVRQSALGLQGAYEAGLVHRDIKPSNLMLVRTRNAARVVIIDWGLVKRAGESAASIPAGGLTGSGIGLGTPDFMAPEQVADARTVDIRADIYSLGATLYALLSGQVPYPDRSTLEKMLAHQKGEPFVPLEQLRRDVPKRLLPVVMKMMARNPGQRFETPAAVADALAFFTTGPNSAKLAALLGSESAPPIQPPPDGSKTWGIPVSMEETPMEKGEPKSKDQQLLDSKTVLAPAPPSMAPHPPTPSGGISRRILLTAVGVVLLLVVVAGAWMMRGDKGTKDDSAEVPKQKVIPAGPRVLINEDFEDAYKKRLPIPEGWSDGDGFRVVKDPAGLFYLEVGKQQAINFVKLPPNLALGDDFVIQVACWLPGATGMLFRLDDSLKTPVVAIAVDSRGSIVIDTEKYAAPTFFRANQPLKIMLKFVAGKLSVILNDEYAAGKDVSRIAEIKMVKLGLTTRLNSTPRVYGVRIGTQGATGGAMQMPAANNERRGKGKR